MTLILFLLYFLLKMSLVLTIIYYEKGDKMVTLAIYFSLQDFISFFKKDLNKVSEIELFRLGNKVKAFFTDLKNAGYLNVPQDNFLGHENKFLGALKRIVNDEPEHDEDNAALAEFLMFQIAGAYHYPGTLDEQYRNFIECVNSGEFFDIDFPRADICKHCGSTLALGSEDWNFSVYAYKEIRDGENLQLEHESVKNCPGHH